MKNVILIVAGALVLATGPAIAASENCLRVGQIDDWQAKDNSTLIVKDTFRRKFKVGLMGTCINLTFKQRIGFSSPGGTSLSCLSSGDTVFFRDSAMGQQRCAVTSVTAYTPEMEKADKDAAAAKQKEKDAAKEKGAAKAQ